METTSTPNEQSSPILSKDQMIEDIDTLINTIEQVHPDMYAYYPQEEHKKDVERLKAALDSEGDAFYLYKKVAPLIAKLGDGHTAIWPVGQKITWNNFVVLPFTFQITYPKKEVFIINDLRDKTNTIPKCAKVISINDRPVNDILKDMISMVAGEKEGFRVTVIQSMLWFQVLYSILYEENSYKLTYLFDNTETTEHIDGILQSKWQELSQKSQDNPQHQENYAFRTLPDKKIGIIEFNAFVDIDKFYKFLQSTFSTLRKENIQNLIIDIRKNPGGDSSLGDMLLQYISPVPFCQFGRAIVKISDISRERCIAILDELSVHEDYLREYYEKLVSHPNGIRVDEDDDELTELNENELRYTGKIYLLTSIKTFSSATALAWAFQYFKMGTIIGEETGGLVVSFGDVISRYLPISCLLYQMSYKKFYLYGSTDANKHGVIPDIPVKASEAMDVAIKMITNQ